MSNKSLDFNEIDRQIAARLSGDSEATSVPNFGNLPSAYNDQPQTKTRQEALIEDTDQPFVHLSFSHHEVEGEEGMFHIHLEQVHMNGFNHEQAALLAHLKAAVAILEDPDVQITPNNEG